MTATAPARRPPSGYAGRREALLDELRFVPVPNANTRVEGALSGQFQYADLLPVEAAIGRIDKGAPAVVPIVTKNFGFPYIVFNTKEGVLAAQPLRRAVQTAVGSGELLAAGFGDNRFFVVEPNFFPKGTPYYSDAGGKLYNERNPQAAKDQAAKAGYNGQPVRIMASRQYEFHYNMALVMAEQLKKAGFKTELQVVDWATLVQRRNDAKLWDVYFTHSGLFPEPMLSPPQLGEGAHRAGGTLPAKKATSHRLQPGDQHRPNAARCGASRAAGGVRRSALHRGRQVQRPLRALGQAARAARRRSGRSSGTRAWPSKPTGTQVRCHAFSDDPPGRRPGGAGPRRGAGVLRSRAWPRATRWRCCWASRPRPRTSPQARVQYGLDKPLPTQFVLWIGELLQGNLGQSIFLQRPVAQALLERAEPTLFLALFAVGIAALIGIPCGMAAAIWRGSATVTRLLSGVAMLGRQRAQLLARA